MAKVSTFTQDFTAALDLALWTVGGDGPVTATGGVLKMEYGTGAFATTSVTSDNTYDLTNDALFVQIADPGPRQTGWLAVLLATGAGTNNLMRMYVSDLYGVVAQIYNAGTVVFSGNGVTYDPLVHKWLRIRHTASSIFFETSTNGSTGWTTLYSTATSTVAWSMTAITVGLTTQRENANASTGYSSFDRLNLAPLTNQGSFFQVISPITTGAATAPPPPPPPPSGTGTLISTFSDFQYNFTPGGNAPPKATGDFESSGGGFQHMYTSPFGPGWDIKCTGLDMAPWGNPPAEVYKAVLGKKVWPFSRIGKTEHWEWWMMLPTQSLVPDFQQGALFEFHTDLSSGHHIYLTGGKINFARQSGQGQVYVRPIGAVNIPYDVWKQYVIDIKWSYGSDGYLNYYYDGNLVHGFTGATAFPGDGEPVLQWGWYARNGTPVDNRVFFGNLRYTQT